jgi:predicted Zn finger-like uncharacterized protein
VKISCPTCAAKYSVADEKIQSRLAKIRCRKCSSTIVIDGMATPPSVYIGESSAPNAGNGSSAGGSSPAAAGEGFAHAGAANVSTPPAATASEPVGPAADEYAVDIADNDQRNMTIHQIVGAYNEGLITADTYIWKEGMADWQTLAEVKAVADALHAAAARPAAPAAVRRNDRGSAPDLFGRIATAGSEDDITTSAPAPAPTFTAGTGARNESSVLFSLSALTGSEATAAPSGGKRNRSPADDSGLIDLSALTAGNGASGGGFGASASAFGASPLISAPLGGVSGPAIGLVPSYGAPRSSGRALIIAASLLAVAIIGGAALFVVNRNNADTEPPTSALDPASPAAAVKPPSPEPEAEPIAQQPEPAAQPTEPASVKDSVSPDELPAAPEPIAKPAPAARPPAPKPRPVAPAPVRAKPAPVSSPSPEPAAVAPAPKPAPVERESEPAAAPAADKKKRCECAPSDLMCAMRCSAKQR